jgi:hypothetical protein
MTMKSVYALLLVTLLSANVFAQDDNDEEKEKGFKKENLFTGGSLNVQFGSGQTSLGASPFFGYSINKYIDVAASIGYSYLSEREYDSYYNYTGGKIRQSIYGPGAFVRIFPVKFLYAQAHYNIIKLKYLYPDSYGIPDEKFNTHASSLLLGAGYAGGREEENKSYFYISIMFDVLKSTYSPYRDYQGNAQPIIRAGYNIALFQNKLVRGRRVSNND